MRVVVLPIANPRGRRIAIGLYNVVVFLYWLSLYLYVPTLPTYAQSKTDNLALVGVILSMYGLWQAVIRLPLGIAADGLGRRKPFILAGLALAGLGAWVMGAACDARGLLLGRAITGLGAGAWVPLVAGFSSLFPPHDAVHAAALLNLSGQLGRILGTSLTGTLNQAGGYPLAFLAAGGVAALAVLLASLIQERGHAPKRPSPKSIGRLIVREDVLLPSLLALVSQYVNWAATFGFLPILAKSLNASDVAQGMMVSLNIGVLILGNLVAAAFAQRLGAQRLVRWSFALLALGVGLAALAPSLAWLFTSHVCIGLAQGIGGPVLMGMSIRHVADEERTTAMGVHQAVYAVGMFAGPGLSGLLADGIGIRPMFGITAVACLALGLLGARRLSERPRPS